jgi:hypothetical protein
MGAIMRKAHLSLASAKYAAGEFRCVPPSHAWRALISKCYTCLGLRFV